MQNSGLDINTIIISVFLKCGKIVVKNYNEMWEQLNLSLFLVQGQLSKNEKQIEIELDTRPGKKCNLKLQSIEGSKKGTIAYDLNLNPCWQSANCQISSQKSSSPIEKVHRSRKVLEQVLELVIEVF